MLRTRKRSIDALLGKMLNPDRFMALVINACRETPGLLKCNPESLFFAVKDAAELGLEPNTSLGHGWLIPFKDECQFIPGYKGFVWKVWDCSQIELWANVVYEGEIFTAEEGTEPKIIHRPTYGGDRSDEKIILVYAVAKLPNGSRRFCVMTKAEVDKIRDGSRGYQAYMNGKTQKIPVWVTAYPEMCKKTAARRLVKYLPIANEKFAKLLEVDDRDYAEGRVIEQPSGPIVKRSINLTAAPDPQPAAAAPPAEEDPFQGGPTREPGEEG